MRVGLVVGLLGTLSVHAHAQDLPPGHPPVGSTPRGPADIIRQGAKAVATTPAMQGAVAQEPDDQVHRVLRGEALPISTEESTVEVSPGTIEVHVRDAAGAPIPRARVEIGLMGPGGARERLSGQSAEDGVARFDRLTTGQDHAYRVRVPYQGALYGSSPFRLPPDQGYRVTVRRLEVTTDDRKLLQVFGQTMIELREDRLHVIQQSQLMNLDERTFVFPSAGLPGRLPAGAMAFQFQEVMTDQRVEESGGTLHFKGSIPPGRVTLTWAYDIPLETGAMTFRVPAVFRTYMYRVMADAAPGMTLEVAGMGAAEERAIETQKVLVTEVERRPGDPPFETVAITLHGVPGPGPLRWIAVGLSIFFLCVGAFFVGRGSTKASDAEGLRLAREHLIREGAAIDQQKQRGEIGPEHAEKERKRITDDLAILLRHEAQSVTPNARR